jgi:hypothetical protein
MIFVDHDAPVLLDPVDNSRDRRGPHEPRHPAANTLYQGRCSHDYGASAVAREHHRIDNAGVYTETEDLRCTEPDKLSGLGDLTVGRAHAERLYPSFDVCLHRSFLDLRDGRCEPFRKRTLADLRIADFNHLSVPYDDAAAANRFDDMFVPFVRHESSGNKLFVFSR